MASNAEIVPIRSLLTNSLEASIEIGLLELSNLMRPYGYVVATTLSRASEETGDFALNLANGKVTTPYILGKLQSINADNQTNARMARSGEAMRTIKGNEIVKLKTMAVELTVECTFYSDDLSTLLDFTTVCLMSNNITSIIETEEAKIYSQTSVPKAFSYIEKSFLNGSDTQQRLESVNFQIMINTHAAITTRTTKTRKIVANLYGPSASVPNYQLLENIIIDKTNNTTVHTP